MRPREKEEFRSRCSGRVRASLADPARSGVLPAIPSGSRLDQPPSVPVSSWGPLLRSGASGGAALQKQGVAAVADAHGPGVGGQGQLVAGTRVAEDVATVAAVVLKDTRQGSQSGPGASVCLTPLESFPKKLGSIGKGSF